MAILPAHDEAATVGSVVRGLRRLGLPVLVVDDGSHDDTAARAAAAGAELLRLPRRGGKGRAVRRGLAAARARGYRHALLLDADGQHRVEDAPRLLARAQRRGAQLVIGNRMRRAAAMPLHRWWANGVMSLLLTLRTGRRVADSQCGYRWLEIEPFLDALRARDFDIESEMWLAAARKRLRTAEVSITAHYPGLRRSRIRFWPAFVRFARLLLQPGPPAVKRQG